MNSISLDTIGMAGFSHDFGALDGKPSAVAEAFDSFGSVQLGSLATILMILSPVLTFLTKIPTPRRKLVLNLHNSMAEIAERLLERSSK